MGYDPAMRKTTSALGSVVVILTMLAVLVCLLMLGSRAFGTYNYDLLILPSLAGFIGLCASAIIFAIDDSRKDNADRLDRIAALLSKQ